MKTEAQIIAERLQSRCKTARERINEANEELERIGKFYGFFSRRARELRNKISVLEYLAVVEEEPKEAKEMGQILKSIADSSSQPIEELVELCISYGKNAMTQPAREQYRALYQYLKTKSREKQK